MNCFTIVYNFFCYLIWIVKRCNYPNYLLQYDHNKNFKLYASNKIENMVIFISIKKFILKHKLEDKGIVVSLSGGVDSMVILYCLTYLKKNMFHNLKISTVSVNYNIRFESNDEMRFLEKYLQKYSDDKTIENYLIVTTTKFSRKNGNNYFSGKNNRKEFEEYSKKLRYNGYRKFINKSYYGVMLGHHKDDVIENIFTNLMYGRSILDLTVIKEVSIKDNIKFLRPMIKDNKSEVYFLAHKFRVPYFKDTTPKWSKRGKMRNEIFPLLDNTFNKWNEKLYYIGKISDELNDFINNYSINNYLNNITRYKAGFSIPDKLFKLNSTNIINKSVLPKMTHSYGVSYFGNKHIKRILQLNDGSFCRVSKKIIVYLEKDQYYFILLNKVKKQKASILNLIDNLEIPDNISFSKKYQKFLDQIILYT